MKCKSSTYVVRHYLTTLKYNNISQVCPYKDLGSAKDYIIILLFLMQPSAGDKPDRMQSQEKHNPIYYAQVKTDYESTWQMHSSVSQRVCSKDNHTLLFKVRILDKHVGLISIHTEQVRTGKLKILICKIVLVQTLKSCSITIFHILMQQ